MQGRPTTTLLQKELRRPKASIARFVAAFCLLLLALGASAQTPAQPRPLSAARSAQDVAIITIEGPIDRWTAFSVLRRIERAERDDCSDC